MEETLEDYLLRFKLPERKSRHREIFHLYATYRRKEGDIALVISHFRYYGLHFIQIADYDVKSGKRLYWVNIPIKKAPTIAAIIYNYASDHHWQMKPN